MVGTNGVDAAAQKIQRRDDGGIYGPLVLVDAQLHRRGWELVPRFTAQWPAEDAAQARRMPCGECDGRCYALAYETADGDVVTFAVCTECECAHEL